MAGSGGSRIPDVRWWRSRKSPAPRVPELLDLLKSYEDRTRYRARRELREQPEQEVFSALTGGSAASKRATPNTGGKCSRRSGCTRASTMLTSRF